MDRNRAIVLLSLVLLPACGGPSPKPSAAPPSTSVPSVAPATPPPGAPVVGADGWIELAQGAWSLKVRPDSHALARVDALRDFVASELDKVRSAMGLSDSDCRGIIVYLHSSSKDGASRTRAYASWKSTGEVSANYLAEPDFDDRTDLFRSLVPNELVKATTFACVRKGPADHLDKPNSALAWLMEGEGTLLHTGGWFDRDVDTLAQAYIAGKLDYPIEAILRSDYQKACRFNPRTTHTFNVIEFPQMASFTRFLWRSHGNEKFNSLLRKVRDAGDEGALNAVSEVYGRSLADLERDWRQQLSQRPGQDHSLEPPRIARLIRKYQSVLEAGARALTFDNENVGSWGKRNGTDISSLPVIKLDLATAEPAIERARDRMVLELRQGARAVESLGAKLSLPIGAKGELLPEGCVVREVIPGSKAQRMGLQKGDEVHLLDVAIQDAAGKPYSGALTVTRGAAQETVLLEPK